MASMVFVPRGSRERLAWIIVTLALASVAALCIGYPRSAPTVAPEMRLEIVTPPGADVSGFAISPDGRALVFQAAVDGESQLWLRPLDSETARPLAGTEGATFPFWSPDNQSVAFFAGGQLKRIDVASGFVQNLADAPLNTRGGAWNAAVSVIVGRSPGRFSHGPGGCRHRHGQSNSPALASPPAALLCRIGHRHRGRAAGDGSAGSGPALIRRPSTPNGSSPVRSRPWPPDTRSSAAVLVGLAIAGNRVYRLYPPKSAAG